MTLDNLPNLNSLGYRTKSDEQSSNEKEYDPQFQSVRTGRSKDSHASLFA